MKKDIQPLENSLHKILNLQGISYNLKDDSSETNIHNGFIAQDVEKIVPNVVTQDEKGIKGIAYDEIIPLLVESIKELQEKIKVLESKTK